MKEAGEGLSSAVHMVADGSPWIWGMFQRLFGWKPNATGVLDLMHVSSYLHAAFEKEPAKARRLREQLRAGEVGVVLEELRRCEEPAQLPEEEAPVRRALRYLENRLGELGYAEALKAKLPVGSGVVESAHRYVLQERLKVPGAAWLEENAKRMVHLCAFLATELSLSLA